MHKTLKCLTEVYGRCSFPLCYWIADGLAAVICDANIITDKEIFNVMKNTFPTNPVVSWQVGHVTLCAESSLFSVSAEGDSNGSFIARGK